MGERVVTRKRKERQGRCATEMDRTGRNPLDMGCAYMGHQSPPEKNGPIGSSKARPITTLDPRGIYKSRCPGEIPSRRRRNPLPLPNRGNPSPQISHHTAAAAAAAGTQLYPLVGASAPSPTQKPRTPSNPILSLQPPPLQSPLLPQLRSLDPFM